MVDDEPVGRAKAPGPEPGTVAVPGQDEQVCPGDGLGGGVQDPVLPGGETTGRMIG
jgi:hypothetical protein